MTGKLDPAFTGVITSRKYPWRLGSRLEKTPKTKVKRRRRLEKVQRCSKRS